MSGSTTQRMATSEQPHATPSGNMGQKIAYAFGNLGQAAFYNTMSTFFITFVTTALFIDVDKTLAKRRSNCVDLDSRANSGDGPDVKRPPHRARCSLFSVMKAP